MSQDNLDAGYRRFREAMQEGTLRPGMTVTQNELCAMLGLSLTPLRETLVLLQEFGLVEVRQRAGIRIIYPEVAFIRENFQFRSVIELHAIRIFAPIVPKDWLNSMKMQNEAILTKVKREDPSLEVEGTFLKLDSEFHSAFVRSLDNHAITSAHNRIMDNIRLARQVHDRTALRKRITDSTGEHLAILRSLERGDPEEAASNLDIHFRASTYRTIVAA